MFEQKILGWPKRSFGFFCKIVQKNPKERFGQSNIFHPDQALKDKSNYKIVGSKMIVG